MKKSIILAIISLIISNYGFAQIETIHPDFLDAKEIGTNQSYTFYKVSDAGKDKAELKSCSCLPEFNFETHSTWIRFKVQVNGTLAFDIVPLKKDDDFDFVLHRISKDQKSRDEIRCMAAGDIIGAPDISKSCQGLTGLSTFSKDKSENRGCAQNKDNFLSSVDVKAGEEYTMCINNFNSTEGFTINFTGTAGFVPTEIESISVSNCTPNPSHEFTNINILSPSIESINYKVYSINGVLISQNNSSITKGFNQLEILTNQLPQGTYKVILSVNSTIFERTFIKM